MYIVFSYYLDIVNSFFLNKGGVNKFKWFLMKMFNVVFFLYLCCNMINMYNIVCFFVIKCK